ncbi:MAG: GIY-YIG nuclease family protein [Saprospiraceae bacterium]|nr:GIY-YIG nuclease family protein [Saprospiraceae bacterium]
MNDYFVVYVLYSFKSQICYYGFTTDLIQRYYAHNFSNVFGFTVAHRPWVVLYSEIYASKSEALKREKFLKSGTGREWVKNSILPLYLPLFSRSGS